MSPCQCKSAVKLLLLGPNFLEAGRDQMTTGRDQVRRGRDPNPRGGAHMDDGRGHAPTLGPTRKRPYSLGEDGALGAEGGGGGK